jgi:hypothetical protein
MSLSARDQAILAFEETWWQLDIAKETAILEQFELSPERYGELLDAILEDPDTETVAPLLVRRLRRQRARGSEDRRSHQRQNTGGAP